MSKKLEKLLAQTRGVEMTPQQREAQRRSFAYGNARLENEHVTPQMIADIAERLAADDAER